MREKYLWMAIAVLTVLTLGQACYIYEETASAKENPGASPLKPELKKQGYSEKATDAQWEEYQRWRDRVQRSLDSGNPLLEPDFDAFFNDTYFSRGLEPFAEMERIHRQMSDQVSVSEKPLFDSYWDKWFEQRMQMGQFATDTSRAGNAVTISILVPGLDAGTADVNITKERIKISFTVNAAFRQQGGGLMVVKEAPRSYVKILPVPADAEPGTGKAVIEGERIKIEFRKKR